MNRMNGGLQRKSLRLKEYDYASSGAYFVTICSYLRESIFGEIKNERVVLNELGDVVNQVWKELPEHYRNIQLDEFVIMPNHVHGILFICNSLEDGHALSLQNVEGNTGGEDFKLSQESNQKDGFKPSTTEKLHGLPEIIRGFKTFSAKQINLLRQTIGRAIWQRSYLNESFETMMN